MSLVWYNEWYNLVIKSGLTLTFADVRSNKPMVMPEEARLRQQNS